MTRPNEIATSTTSNAARRHRDSAMVSDPLKRYLADISRYPTLDRGEELALAERYRAGDAQAGQRLTQCSLRLVVKIARDHQSRRIPLLDLIQEGNLGLMRAVEKFEPERGLRLSSCARWWIRAHVLKYLMDNHRLIRLGTTQAQRKLFFNLRKAHAHFKREGIEATPERVAEHLGVKPRDVREMDSRLSNREASLNSPLKQGDSQGTTMMELLPETGESAEQRLSRQQLQGMLRDRLSTFREGLVGRDVAIWDRRLLSDSPATLKQLGETFGVSRERARQLEARLTSDLGDYLGKELRELGVDRVEFPMFQ